MTSLFARATQLLTSGSSTVSSDVVERVLRELEPDMRAWLVRWTGRSSDVDDLLQDALIELADALERYRGESSVRTYARRITLRVVSRARRKRRDEPSAELHLVRDPAALSPETIVADRDALRRFHAALDRLNETRRNAFILCAIEGLSHDEAATIENVSLETFRARLKRGRAELEDLLREDELLGRFFSAEEPS